jgi:tetratricopeptide (TPR) repeat protein
VRQGRHAQARQLSQLALERYRPMNAPGLLVAPLASWGGSSVELGLYDEAQECFAEALEHAGQAGNRLMIASLENHLGALEIHRQNFPAADAHLRQAQRVAEEIGSLETLARASNDLGALYERQGNFAAALPAFEKALDINQIAKNTFSVIINLNNLGFLKRRLGRVEEAGRDHRQALEQALRLDATPLALDALIGLGAALHESGQPELARSCLAFVRQHPQADRQTEEELVEVLRQLGLTLQALDGIQALAADLAQIADRLQGRFAAGAQ